MKKYHTNHRIESIIVPGSMGSDIFFSADGLTRRLRKRFSTAFPTILLTTVVTFFSSCENKMEEVQALTKKENIPEIHSVDIEIFQTDSGLIAFRMFAPDLKRFTDIKRPYVEFQKGLKVLGYDRYQNIESSITANYAKHYEDERIWIAENDVVAVNNKEGNILNTEYLVWDMEKKKIYSDNFCRITTHDGVFYGENGFEADETFSKWRLRKTKGEINVKDE
ncbi:MAG: LPS export ABC transporter periplasmic protein LptC [Bacteroidetes bacterium]|nr:LPS export ABC transporter periplasmic protein LptC [Bacteroidota bacterium]